MAEQTIPDYEWRLRIGTRLSGFAVRPDSKWPGMWRIHTPDGKISDMVNLSRARDSALILARKHSRATGHGSADLPVYWEKAGYSVADTPPTRPDASEVP